MIRSGVMPVIDTYTIRGIGLTAVVSDVPPGLKEGCIAHQGEHAWRIVGVNRSTNSDNALLTLKPLQEDGVELEKTELLL